MKNIKVVFFDLDNTLIDRNKAIIKYFNWLVDSYSQDCIDKNERINYLLELDDNGMTDKHYFYEKIIADWNLYNIDTEDFIKIWKCEFCKHTVIMENAYQVLSYLAQKYLLGIISNGYWVIQNRKINSVGIANYFDLIATSEALGCKKPNKEIFIKSCDLLGVDVNEAVYVGDHYTNDVLGASNAGLFPIWFNSSNINIKSKYKVINNLLELITFL